MLAGMTYGYLSGDREMAVILAVLLGLAVAVLAAIGTEILVVRPVAKRGRNEFAVVMAVVALLFVLQQLAGLVYGHQAIVSAGAHARRVPTVGRIFIVDDQQILGVLVTLAAFALVAIWIQFGRYGRMLRAVGDNAGAATALGLPVKRVRLVAMTVAGLVAGTAGITVAPLAGVTMESPRSRTPSSGS